MPSDNLGTLSYTIATDAGSSVAAAQVSGGLVTTEEALTSRKPSSLPPGSQALFAMHFTPDTAPGEGFSGTIRLRYLLPDGTAPKYSGLADIFYITPATLEPVLLDSAYQQADGWFSFHVNALGYFVVALENGFRVRAFADMAAAAGGEPVNFRARSTNGVEPVSYAWDFGDGQTGSGILVTHSYAAPGSYLVALTAQDASGAQAVAASSPIVITGFAEPISAVTVAVTRNPQNGMSFDYYATVTGGTPPFTYAWEFDLGQPDAQDTPAPTFTFATPGIHHGKLTVTDSLGATASTTFDSDAVPPPITGITVDAIQDSGNLLHFTYSAAVTGGTAPYSYAWEFAPGVAGPEDAPSTAHTFSAPGTYQGLLTVTDSFGVVATQPFVSDAQVPPFTGLTVDVVQDAVDPLTFHYTATVSGGSAPFSYAWEFAPGIGGTEDLPAVSHTFAALGTYNGQLTVTDKYGLVATQPFVSDAQAPPISDVTVDVFQDAENGLAFTYLATVTGGTAPFTYQWEFETGVIDSQNTPTPSYTFPQRGLYSGKLTVTDRFGFTASTAFISDARPPVITDVIPARAKIGEQIQIIGEYFLAQQGGGVVELEGLALPIVSWSDKLIVATIPPGAVSGKLTVLQRGRSNAFDFTVFP